MVSCDWGASWHQTGPHLGFLSKPFWRQRWDPWDQDWTGLCCAVYGFKTAGKQASSKSRNMGSAKRIWGSTFVFDLEGPDDFIGWTSEAPLVGSISQAPCGEMLERSWCHTLLQRSPLPETGDCILMHRYKSKMRKPTGSEWFRWFQLWDILTRPRSFVKHREDSDKFWIQLS